MRQIIFRGKSIDDGEWVFGWLADGNMICDWNRNHKKCFEVKANTVGQYTGMKDNSDLLDKKNKKTPIYEGDIVLIYDEDFVVVGVGRVEFFEDYGLWYVDGEGEANNGLGDIKVSYYVKVIGNIHDNNF